MGAPDWLSRLFAQPTIRNGAGTNMPSRSNIKFVGPVVTDDAANDQTIVDTTGGAVTLAGDAVGPAGTNTVQTLTGSAGVVSLVAASLLWAAAAVSPSLSQAISTTGAGQSLSVSAQAAKVGSAANGGALILSGGLKDGAGADGDVIVRNGGTEVFRATADTTLQFAAGVATPTIKQAISTSGAGVAFLISAQDAKAGSAANGGDLQLQGGAKDGAGTNGRVIFARLTGTSGFAAISTAGVISVSTSLTASWVAPGTAGQIFVSNATPTAAWTSLISYETTHGRFQAGGGGTDYKAVLGPHFGSETGAASLSLLPNATAATATNYVIRNDGTFTYINDAFGSGQLFFYSGGSTQIGNAGTTGWNFNSGILNFNTSTTPSILSGTSATSLAVGTNKAGATLLLQADTGSTVATLTKVSSTSSSAIFSSPGLASAASINVNDNGAVFMGANLSTNYILFNGTSGNTYVSSTGPHTFNNNSGVTYGAFNSSGLLVKGTGTTPLVQGDTTSTSLTVGTNKSAATLALQGDAAVTGVVVGNTNVQLCSGTVGFGGGTGVVGITDRTVAPTSNPAGGGILYSESGALKWRGSSGTITTIALA